MSGRKNWPPIHKSALQPFYLKIKNLKIKNVNLERKVHLSSLTEVGNALNAKITTSREEKNVIDAKK